MHPPQHKHIWAAHACPTPSSLQGQNLQMKAAAIKHNSSSKISRTEKISKAGN